MSSRASKLEAEVDKDLLQGYNPTEKPELMKEVSQIRRPFHARSLVLVSQCRLLKGRVALQGNPSSERALISRKALNAAVEAVPSNSSFLRLQTRAITEARIFDNVFELISKFLGTYGFQDLMHPFKSDLLQSTRRDQKALSLLNEEIRRQENRQMAVASTGSTAKLRIRICRESMDAPKEMDLGLFDTSTRLDIVLWKTTTPTDSKGPHILLKEHPNFYAKQAKKHKHTKDGVLFERLTPERSIESLPSEDGTRVVHLVTSKYPYILAARGHSPRSLGQQSSHGLLSKDFGSLKTDAFKALNDQLLKHITYEIRNVSSDLVVNQENSQSLLQKDIPPDTLRFYKSDWLIVLDQTSPDPEEKRPTQLMVPSQVPGELGGTSRPGISRSTTPTPSRPATPPAMPASAPQNGVEQQPETRKEKKKGFRSFFGWG